MSWTRSNLKSVYTCVSEDHCVNEILLSGKVCVIFAALLNVPIKQTPFKKQGTDLKSGMMGTCIH